MTPITFSCTACLPLAPRAVGEQILDLSRWPEFTGYGPLPGIMSAEFEVRTDTVVGSRIRVVNTDRSTHVETITEWAPEHRLVLELADFGKPLARFATRFVETWELSSAPDGTCVVGTCVVRRFDVYPTGPLARPMLWLITRLLRRAVRRHLSTIRASSIG